MPQSPNSLHRDLARDRLGGRVQQNPLRKQGAEWVNASYPIASATGSDRIATRRLCHAPGVTSLVETGIAFRGGRD